MTLPLELPSGTVHLWYMSVTDTRILLDNHLSVLDEEEKYRANRFHFEPDRTRFILAHGSLRSLLARYTGSDPALIRFKQNRYGKPFLQHPHSPVQFNVTHSAGFIIHAVAHGTELGVDVELVRNSAGLASVASYFAPVSRHGCVPQTPRSEMFDFSLSGYARKHTSRRLAGGFPSLWRALK